MEIESEWVVQISNESSSSSTIIKEMEEKWKKHCIYKIPPCITHLNKCAYKPQTVSFGPYHNGKEDVVGMEEHKQRALVHFLNKCGKSLELLIQSMSEVKDDLRDSYKPLIFAEGNDSYDDHDHHGKFLKMMILDGCFMLEVLRNADHNDNYGDYANNDPVFSDHGRLYAMPLIKRDMLVLENQLPMVVLDKLIEFEGSKKTQEGEFLNKLIFRFLWRPRTTPPIPNFGKCLHILDLYRKIILQHEPLDDEKDDKKDNEKDHEKDDEKDDEIMRPARELLDAGVCFRRSDTRSLKDVSFNGGVLSLPLIVIDDCTETVFLNLTAFERLHVGVGNDISWYLYFMDNVIDQEIDVAILHRVGIICNALGSDKAVAKLFNSLTKNLPVDPRRGLHNVQKSVCTYCQKPWNRWRANLIETYFRNPWAIVSLVAAFVLFALTIIQTVYSIKGTLGDDPSKDTSTPKLPPRRD